MCNQYTEKDAKYMYESTTIWGIHAGAMGEVDKLFLSKNNPSIAIGWPKMGNLSLLKQDREDFKNNLSKCYPDTKKGAIPTSAGMLYRFIHEIKKGDLIVYPSKQDRNIHIGEINGTYEFKPDLDKEYPHVRCVKWLKHVPRTDLSQGALYEIGSALSLFQVKNYADDFIAVLEGKPSIKKDEPDETVANILEVTEQNTKDFLFKKLSKELKGHPFEHFVAHILNIIGYNTQVSPEGGDGGIDIIAFKDELGIEPPIIKVQVKSTDGDVTPEKVQALYGNISNGEYGLFITLSNFSKQAKQFAKSKPNLRIIDGDELIQLILKNYEKLDSKYKAIIPLKNIYIPTQVEGE